jgi:hypothetical protein
MALTQNQVSMLYVAIFNRASEGAGNKYWQENQPDMVTTADAMISTDDAKEYFGDTLEDNQAFIELIYKNTLNKTAEDDPDGINYWVNELESGKSKGEVVTSLLNAVLDYKDSDDPTTKSAYDQFVNRVEVSNYTADNFEGENLPEIMPDYKVELGFGEGNKLNVTSDPATVESAKAEINNIVEELGDTAEDMAEDIIQLTANPDNLTGNTFEAPRVWNPDGSDQMNSLNDDDILTGEGDNPTLNVTIINDTESRDLNIMPTLNNIATINTEFTADFSQTIDLQDATGIKNLSATRIDDIGSGSVTYDNIQSALETATVKNSNDNTGVDMIFDHSASALAGDADEVELTLSNVQMDELRIDSLGEEGYETINLVSTGSDANSLNTLTDEDIQTLNISGDKSLTIAGEKDAAGSLTKVDATALEADLDFRVSQGVINAAPDGTSNGDVAFSLLSGAGNDTIRVSDQIGSTDTISVGDGDDTLVIEAVDPSNNYTAKDTTITGVEAVELLNSYQHDEATIAILADEIDGDQTFLLRNNTDGSGNKTTYNVMNLSEVEAQQITIEHSGDKETNPTGASNNLEYNRVNIDVEDGVSEVAITIGEGNNSDPTFNFQLYTDSNLEINETENAGGIIKGEDDIKDNKIVNNVTSLTIHDDDSESNTIQLLAVSADKDGEPIDKGTSYTDTITITGGKENKYLNLDATANIYGLDQSGVNEDLAHAVKDDIGISIGDIGTDNAERLIVENFDASESKSDIVVRFSDNINADNGAQNIKTGSGNDTIIFDDLGDTRAGLTISDEVDAGEGNDTLVIDGDLSNMDTVSSIQISDSEWTNVRNFENLRLVGNGSVGGVDNSYDITLTNSFIASNHDENGLLNIINDNGHATKVDDATKVSAVTIHAESLSDSSHFSYNGEEGEFATKDRIIVSDANVNGKNIIDGGYITSIEDSNGSYLGNGDVLEIRNKAVVTIGDLDNVSNIGTLEFSNDQAVMQDVKLQLDDNVIDRLVNDEITSVSRTSVDPNPHPERLYINVLDSEVITSVDTATTGLTLDADKLTNRSDVDILLGRGDNDIQTGAGNDRVILLGNYEEGEYEDTVIHSLSGNDGVNINDYYTSTSENRVVNDNIDLGDGEDTLETYGNLDLTNANLEGIEHIVSHSSVIISIEQLTILNSIEFVSGNKSGEHKLIIEGDVNLDDIKDDIAKKLTDNSVEVVLEDSDESYVVSPDETAEETEDSNGGSEESENTAVEEDDSAYTKVELTGNTTGQEGVAEEFIYQIDSSSGDVISLVGTDVSLSSFTVGEDILTFVDVENGTVTTETFADSVTVSASSINDVTDIYFAEDNDGNSYQLSVVGVVDETLDSMDVSVTQA